MENGTVNEIINFTEDELCIIKLLKILNNVATYCLTRIYVWAYPENLTYRVESILNRRYTKKSRKDIFKKIERKRISECNDIRNNDFDSALLILCLKHLSLLDSKNPKWKLRKELEIKLADDFMIETIYEKLAFIEAYRGKFYHFKLTPKEIRKLLLKLPLILYSCIGQAGRMFSRDSKEISAYEDEIFQNLDEINCISILSLDEASEERRKFDEYYQEVLKNLGKEELLHYNKELCLIKPLGWQFEYGQTNASKLYTNISFKSECNGGSRDVADREILDSDSNVTVITGNEGEGKTMFLKTILSTWCKNSTGFNTDNFDYVFYIDSNNIFQDTFDEFILKIFKETFEKIKPSDFAYLKNLLLKLNILFLFDGYNEHNMEFEKLVYEVLEQTGTNVKHIFTTRSPHQPHLQNLLQRFDKTICNLSILEFPKERWMKLVAKVTKSLVKDQELAKEAREKVYIFLNLKEYDFWELSNPFILTWLSIISVENPNSLKGIITVSNLYEVLEKIIVQKLVSNMIFNDPVTFKQPELEIGIRNVIGSFGKIAYNSVLEDSDKLSANNLNLMMEKCKENNIPPNFILSAFFNEQLKLQGNLVQKTCSFIHRSVLQYYAAKYICEKICNESVDALEDLNKAFSKNFSSFLDMIIFISDFLSKMNKLTENKDKLLKLVEYHGSMEPTYWLELLAKKENIPILVKGVSEMLIKHNLNEWRIKDNKLLALNELLKYTEPKTIHIIYGDVYEAPAENYHLKQAIEKLSKMAIPIKIDMVFYFVTMEDKHADDLMTPILKSQLNKCSLERFQGSLSREYIFLLPMTIKTLILRTSTDELRAVCDILPNLKDLNIIEIHFLWNEEDSPLSLPKLLTDASTIIVDLSEIGDDRAVWAGQALGVLCKGVYHKVKLFNSLITYNGTVELVQEMAKNGVKIKEEGFLEVRSNYDINEDELSKLNVLCGNYNYKLFWRLQ